MAKFKLAGVPVATRIYDQLGLRIPRLKEMSFCPTLRFGIADNDDDQVYRNMLVKKADALGINVICDVAMDHNHSVVSRAIMETLKYYGQELEGKRACVIGRSKNVGLPIANALLAANATVTVCHSKTDIAYLYHVADDSDIIISATGVHGILDRIEWGVRVGNVEQSLTKRRVIVDIGCNVQPDGTTVGDIDPNLIRAFSNVLYTPVPGGIGPVTIAVEMLEAVERCEREAGIKQ